MSKRMFLAITFGCAVALQSATAHADPRPVEKLELAIADIRAGLDPGGKYAYVPKIDRRDIEEQLNIMASLLRGVDAIEDMNQRRKIRLFNAQERVNGLLLQAEGARTVCESHKVTGSHMTSTVCMTQAEKEAAKDTTSRTWLNYLKGAKGPSG
ncbi:MAG: hypothetical protein IPK97_00935 [Ahniella sp.]|nr:hypothetical protein [Ahniella sp.]